MYIYHNENPKRKYTGDCVIRAISFVENLNWRLTVLILTAYTLDLCELVDDNTVWKTFLLNRGYVLHPVINTSYYPYTLRDFCKDHNKGRYIACTGSHVIAVINGDYYDTWDSGDEIITFYFRKEE